MAYLIFFFMVALALPAVTGWAENRDEIKAEIKRMADRDRAAQATRPYQRRMKYARAGRR